MGLNSGQTPIDPEEYAGLKISSIATQKELNEFEQNNIENALEWLLGNKLSQDGILNISFVLELHKQMFSDVWKWAGQIRLTNKNIGVDKFMIIAELGKLLEDAKYWIENRTFPADEIAIRFKHRIVKIHAFPNGNGRHSRIMADIISSRIFEINEFSWGGNSLYDEGKARNRYIKALQAADSGNYESLIEFSRS